MTAEKFYDDGDRVWLEEPHAEYPPSFQPRRSEAGIPLTNWEGIPYPRWFVRFSTRNPSVVMEWARDEADALDRAAYLVRRGFGDVVVGDRDDDPANITQLQPLDLEGVG